MTFAQNRGYQQAMMRKRREQERILEQWTNSPEADYLLKQVQEKRKPTIEPKDLPF